MVKEEQTIFDSLRTFTSFVYDPRSLLLKPIRSRSLRYSNNRSSRSGHHVVDSKYGLKPIEYRWKRERWLTRRSELEALELVQSMEIDRVRSGSLSSCCIIRYNSRCSPLSPKLRDTQSNEAFSAQTVSFHSLVYTSQFSQSPSISCPMYHSTSCLAMIFPSTSSPTFFALTNPQAFSVWPNRYSRSLGIE